MTEWYYKSNDKKYGPVTSNELKELATSGKLEPNDLVWKEGFDKWHPASRINGLPLGGDRYPPQRESQPTEEDMPAPDDSKAESDYSITLSGLTSFLSQWKIPIAITSGLLFIYWIGWVAIVTFFLWIVILASVVIAIYLGISAVHTEEHDEKVKRWVFTGCAGVVVLSAWFLIPSPPIAMPKIGINKKQLKLAAHTMAGFSKNSGWTGSAGVIKRENGKLWLVTNRHNLALNKLSHRDLFKNGFPDNRAYRLEVVFASGKRKRVLQMAVQDEGLDIALLEVDASGLHEGKDYVLLLLSDRINSRLTQGDEVVVVGSPNGLVGTQTFGRISAFREFGTPEFRRFIQTDAAINLGNSGGPLFYRSDKDRYYWIGINTWIVKQTNNLGFAIDSRNVKETQCQWFSANARGASEAISSILPMMMQYE